MGSSQTRNTLHILRKAYAICARNTLLILQYVLEINYLYCIKCIQSRPVHEVESDSKYITCIT